MNIIDGKKVSEQIKKDIKKQVAWLNSADIYPLLAVIIVGDNKASEIYVRNKEKACGEVGINSKVYKLSQDTTQEQLLELISDLNKDRFVNGILIQLPLPNSFDKDLILNSIDKLKDVDCFNPYNAGQLFLGVGKLKPCTPSGIIELLKYYNITIKGKHCVVVGRSNIVGKPIAQMLLDEDGAVTVVHSKIANLEHYTKQADILVVTVGKPKFITCDMVKEGAVVIDVGINRIDGKLYGDVDFEKVKHKASFITPVPGGVGPMTIAMLLKNCLCQI